MSCHVYHSAPGIGPKILRRVNKICKNDYGIDNLAIQIEDHSDPDNVMTHGQELHVKTRIMDSPNAHRRTGEGGDFEVVAGRASCRE